MSGINIGQILSYGVIGLGFLLALLAYRLLTKEQKLTSPRETVFRAVYVFMAFSVVLCVVGVFGRSQGSSEEMKKNPSAAPTCIADDTAMQQQLSQGVRNYFDSQDWLAPEPSLTMGLAKGIVRRFDTEPDVFNSINAVIEKAKREDANWTYANRSQSALALVYALGLSPTTKEKNQAFLSMTIPAITPKPYPKN